MDAAMPWLVQGGSSQSSDYVSRSEFRILLVRCCRLSAPSIHLDFKIWCFDLSKTNLCVQVYLHQYFELYSLFDDIDTRFGCAYMCLQRLVP